MSLLSDAKEAGQSSNGADKGEVISVLLGGECFVEFTPQSIHACKTSLSNICPFDAIAPDVLYS